MKETKRVIIEEIEKWAKTRMITGEEEWREFLVKAKNPSMILWAEGYNNALSDLKNYLKKLKK